MSEFIPTMTKTITEHRDQLARLRRCSKVEALEAMSKTYQQNFADCHGADDEAYWRAAVEITDRLIADERGFAGATPRETYK